MVSSEITATGNKKTKHRKSNACLETKCGCEYGYFESSIQRLARARCKTSTYGRRRQKDISRGMAPHPEGGVNLVAANKQKGQNAGGPGASEAEDRLLQKIIFIIETKETLTGSFVSRT